jgi:general secretion pathway protein H
LLVVMVMVVLMFTVAGVSMSRSLTGAEVRNAARDMTAGLRQTRGMAITQRQQQVFLVDADARTWQTPGRAPVSLPEGLEITLTTARSELTGNNAGGIRFYPDGASTGGRVVLSADGREWHITVGWLTGEISRDREAER